MTWFFICVFFYLQVGSRPDDGRRSRQYVGIKEKEDSMLSQVRVEL